MMRLICVIDVYVNHWRFGKFNAAPFNFWNPTFFPKKLSSKIWKVLKFAQVRPTIFNTNLSKYTYRTIGPGSCTVNTSLEFLRKHAILHDAFGRFYSDHGKGPGYTYCLKMPHCVKKSPLMGQISGILYCLIAKPVV